MSNEIKSLLPSPPPTILAYLGSILVGFVNHGSHASMQEDKCAATYTAQEFTSVHSPTVLTHLDTLGCAQVVRAVVDFWTL